MRRPAPPAFAFVTSLLVTTLAPPAGHAADASAPFAGHALVIASGCETPSANNTGSGTHVDKSGPGAGHWNLFRPEVETTVGSLAANGWQTRVLYDSNQWERPWPNSAPLTRAAIFDELKARFKEAKSGEQFLISINTHGSIDPHEICLGDHTMLKVSDFASDLKKLVGKGVKVAVVDTSCYSGASVNDLATTGACVLSGGPATVTGAGDTIVPFLFGPGLPAGAAISSYYLSSIPSARLDLDGDGSISAAEAFAYARLNAMSPGLPFTSDCKLDTGHIRALLEGTAPLLRVMTGCLRENRDDEEVRPEKGEACRVAEAGLAFQGLVASGLTQATLAQAQNELAALSPKDESFTRPLADIARSLREHSAALAALVVGHESDQDRADALIAKNQPVPDEIKNRLLDADSRAGDLKRAVFKDLRPLVQLACDSERASRPKDPRPCESFNLYRKPAT